MRVVLTKHASRALRSLSANTERRIRSKLDQLALDEAGLRNMIKALKGGSGALRLRIGDWRVIYSVEGDDLIVLRIAHRREAYR